MLDGRRSKKNLTRSPQNGPSDPHAFGAIKCGSESDETNCSSWLLQLLLVKIRDVVAFMATKTGHGETEIEREAILISFPLRPVVRLFEGHRGLNECLSGG